MTPPPTWRFALEQSACTFVGTAAFPRLAHRLRWPTRAGPRGVLLYIAYLTLVQFAIRTWVIPQLGRLGEEHERAKVELREELGRDPTLDELIARLDCG